MTADAGYTILLGVLPVISTAYTPALHCCMFQDLREKKFIKTILNKNFCCSPLSYSNKP